MKRLLLIVTAALALVVCGMARANYQYGSGFDDQFDRKSNDLRHFNDRPFDNDQLFDRDWYDFRHLDDRWFDGSRDDLQYFDDRPFKHDRNDLRYFDSRVIASLAEAVAPCSSCSYEDSSCLP
jgi:hypothetical protein